VSGFTLSSQAARELDEIVTYVADHDGVDRALEVLESLEDSFRFLADARHAGRERLDLTPAGVRWWNVDNLVVIYFAEASPIVVLRVIHGMRNLDLLVRFGGA
jgi:plasmid stabilization system protein ParE